MSAGWPSYFSELKPGDTVYVDVRRLFMADHEWVPATFVRWDNAFAGREREYIPGPRNTMVVDLGTQARHTPPLLDRISPGVYKVSTQDVRCRKSPLDAST